MVLGPFRWTEILTETILCWFHSQLPSAHQKHRVKEKSVLLRSPNRPQLSGLSLYTLDIRAEIDFSLAISVSAIGVTQTGNIVWKGTPPAWLWENMVVGESFLSFELLWVNTSVFFYNPLDWRAKQTPQAQACIDQKMSLCLRNGIFNFKDQNIAYSEPLKKISGQWGKAETQRD